MFSFTSVTMIPLTIKLSSFHYNTRRSHLVSTLTAPTLSSSRVEMSTMYVTRLKCFLFIIKIKNVSTLIPLLLRLRAFITSSFTT